MGKCNSCSAKKKARAKARALKVSTTSKSNGTVNKTGSFYVGNIEFKKK